MKNFIPRFLKFQGFNTIEFKEWLTKRLIEIYIEPAEEMKCCRCGECLDKQHSSYKMKVRDLDIKIFKTVIIFNRRKGYCNKCKKIRSEYIDFICPHSPHITKELAWSIGKHCEACTLTDASYLMDEDKMLCYRVDYRILQRLLAGYKIPGITRISVDEVYTRKKKKESETRDDLFFTIITDLKTNKVIYVAPSRRKEALDSFFILLGEEACKKIEVVACDQHEAYKNSVEEYCKNATVVWDRFHLMQNFNEAINEARKTLFHKKGLPDEFRKGLQGKNRFIFLSRDKNRNDEQQEFVKKLIGMNQEFLLLELIKEKFASFFDALDEAGAREIWDDLGVMIYNLWDKSVYDWYKKLDNNFEQVLNYFKYRVTTAVSEGINNVIKMLKRKAFGHRNMEYFRLKILQKCGWLNSRSISNYYELSQQI